MDDTNMTAPEKRDDSTDEPVAPLIDPAEVPNMTKADINDVTADGLKEDTGPKRDAADGLAEASDKIKTPEREPNPFSSGPGSDIA